MREVFPFIVLILVNIVLSNQCIIGNNLMLNVISERYSTRCLELHHVTSSDQQKHILIIVIRCNSILSCHQPIPHQHFSLIRSFHIIDQHHIISQHYVISQCHIIGPTKYCHIISQYHIIACLGRRMILEPSHKFFIASTYLICKTNTVAINLISPSFAFLAN